MLGIVKLGFAIGAGYWVGGKLGDALSGTLGPNGDNGDNKAAFVLGGRVVGILGMLYVTAKV